MTEEDLTTVSGQVLNCSLHAVQLGSAFCVGMYKALRQLHHNHSNDMQRPSCKDIIVAL